MTTTATSTSDYMAAPNGMPATALRTELAQRSGAGIDVSLWWVQREDVDEVLVCVCDRREAAYFAISAEPYLALDVYCHPFVYRDFSSLDHERVNAISLAALDDFRRDSDLFRDRVANPETQRLIQTAMQRGLQTREAELELGAMLPALGREDDQPSDRNVPTAVAGQTG